MSERGNHLHLTTLARFNGRYDIFPWPPGRAGEMASVVTIPKLAPGSTPTERREIRAYERILRRNIWTRDQEADWERQDSAANYAECIAALRRQHEERDSE